jgi:fumarate hydratase class II
LKPPLIEKIESQKEGNDEAILSGGNIGRFFLGITTSVLVPNVLDP